MRVCVYAHSSLTIITFLRWEIKSENERPPTERTRKHWLSAFSCCFFQENSLVFSPCIKWTNFPFPPPVRFFFNRKKKTRELFNSIDSAHRTRNQPTFGKVGDRRLVPYRSLVQRVFLYGPYFVFKICWVFFFVFILSVVLVVFPFPGAA